MKHVSRPLVQADSTAGLERALYDAPRSGAPATFTARQRIGDAADEAADMATDALNQADEFVREKSDAAKKAVNQSGDAFRKMRDEGRPEGYDPAAYAEMAQMGWAGIIIPEDHGGSDFGFLSLGLVLEGDQGLYGRLTGRQNLELYARLAGASRDVARARAGEMLEMLGLETRAVHDGAGAALGHRLGGERGQLLVAGVAVDPGDGRLVPALGESLPDVSVLEGDHSATWRRLLAEASKSFDIVIVDTPAGMFGTTRQVLSSCTHVLGVLQAESIAERSFLRFHDGLKSMGEKQPQLLGVVLNMLQTRHVASLSVLQEACGDLTGQTLFDTTIPRHVAFLDARPDVINGRPAPCLRRPACAGDALARPPPPQPSGSSSELSP